MQALQFAVDNRIIPQQALKMTKLEEVSGLGRDVNGDWVRKALDYTLSTPAEKLCDAKIYGNVAFVSQMKAFIREMMIIHDL